MNWLTDNKIPVGRTAADAFDWLQDNGAFVFDAIADAMETLIDGFSGSCRRRIRCLSWPFFVALTWALQRSWKPASSSRWASCSS
jgi:glycine betaine/proline transport system permease protein